jgi:hypothetical protein
MAVTVGEGADDADEEGAADPFDAGLDFGLDFGVALEVLDHRSGAGHRRCGLGPEYH